MNRLFITSIVTLIGCGNAKFSICPKQEVVQPFDVEAYQGTWYEIAATNIQRLTFQRGCRCTYAQYELKEDESGKYVEVNNTCLRDEGSDEDQSILGRATLTSVNQEGEFAVGFGENSGFSFGAIYENGANYLVLKQGIDPSTNEQYTVVGAPCKLLAWVLSRSTKMSDETYNDIKKFLRSRGYWTFAIGLRRTFQDDDVCESVRA
eukprot:Pgem_evm1s1638